MDRFLVNKRNVITLDGVPIQFNEDTGSVQLSSICKAGGKEFKDWRKLDSTQKFLDELSSSLNVPVDDLIKTGKFLRFITEKESSAKSPSFIDTFANKSSFSE